MILITANQSYLVSVVGSSVISGWWCQVFSHIWSVVSNRVYQVVGLWLMVSGQWCQVGGISYMVSRVWYLVGGIRLIVLNGWHMVGGITSLVWGQWCQVGGMSLVVSGQCYLVSDTRLVVSVRWHLVSGSGWWYLFWLVVSDLVDVTGCCCVNPGGRLGGRVLKQILLIDEKPWKPV